MRTLGYFALIGLMGCAGSTVAIAQSPAAVDKSVRATTDPNVLAAARTANSSTASKPSDVRIQASRERFAEGIYAAARAARTDGLTAAKADRTAARVKLAAFEKLSVAAANRRHDLAGAATAAKTATKQPRRKTRR